MTKGKYIPRTALVACSRLVDFAGAEIASLEIAQALRELGVEVELAALEIGAPFEEEIKLSGIKCIDLSATSISGREFDLLWVSHYVVAYHLLIKEELRVKTCVYSSLSYFEPLETPPLSSLLFSRYLVNSEENFDHFANHYPDFAKRLNIFPNAAPAVFLNAYREFLNPEIKSIAVISNHPPDEITELINLLRADGVEVDLIGIQGKKIRVLPEVLSRYSAVITIGKTVQYCLVTGTPVFCYDHFGGPGWINLESFDAAFRKNFSGRCTPTRRTSESILYELLEGFNCVLNQREALRDLARVRFDLTKNLINVLNTSTNLDIVVTLSATDREIISRESCLFSSLRQVIGNLQQTVSERDGQIAGLSLTVAERDVQFAGLSHTVAERDVQIVNFSRLVAERDGQIASLSLTVSERDGQIASIYRSKSWRMMAPIRIISQNTHIVLIATAVRVAWLRFLITRSFQVMRYQGFAAYLKKATRYLGGVWRRKITALNVRDNFKTVTLNAIASETDNPIVSFVIPIYDRTDTLRISIQSALDQTYRNIEVILVTDGSPPETLKVVSEFINDPRVKIFNFPTSSGNAVRGRNKGILESNGRYIAFLDSDDVAMPNRIELSLPLLESGEADVMYGAWRALLDGTRDVAGLTNGQLIFSPDCNLEILKEFCVPCQSTVIVRKNLLYLAGFLKPKMKYREDHELWARLAHFGGTFKSIPHALVSLRLHAGNNELNFKHDDLRWQSLLSTEYTLPAIIPKKIAFIVAGLGISGGLVVILKYANFLMSIGHDVFIINVGEAGTPDWAGINSVPIIQIDDKRRYIFEKIDLLFATFWTTCEWLSHIPAKRKLYFIQSDERLFYEDVLLKERVAATYTLPYEFITIAGWICEVLDREFSKKSYLVPNGIDTKLFRPSAPLIAKNDKRLRVLIEGPISISFKGVADAYAAIESLDCDIWIVSSAGKPESNWRIDRFFESVAFNDMPKIYSACDVLLKMSRIESFSYPPLEAMACGCAVVVGKVFGSIEYVVDGVNALVVEQKDINKAREAVKRLLDDSELRTCLVNEGYETVKNWTWECSFESMLKVVDGISSEEKYPSVSG